MMINKGLVDKHKLIFLSEQVTACFTFYFARFIKYISSKVEYIDTFNSFLSLLAFLVHFLCQYKSNCLQLTKRKRESVRRDHCKIISFVFTQNFGLSDGTATDLAETKKNYSNQGYDQLATSAIKQKLL